MRVPVHVFVDFDGTISLSDTTDLLLERFADPAWTEIEAAWERGEIGSRECMIRQIDLLRIGPEALNAFVESVEIDPAFPDFVQLCHTLGVPVTVVSDGLDLTITGTLSRFGLDLAILANRLESRGGERWKLSFPHAREDCRTLSGHCKCRSFGHERLRILIGDGRSDFCGADEADMVFAKDRLRAYCREKALPHVPFSNFAELAPVFSRWVAAARLDLPARLTDYNGKEHFAE